MSIAYTIVDFDATQGQIVVKTEQFGKFVIDLPINPEGIVPSGTELEAYIQGFLPHSTVQRAGILSSVGIVNASDIYALVVPEPETEPEVEEDDPEPTYEEKFALIRVERNRQLYISDWVDLPKNQARHTAEWIAAWDTYRQALRDLPANISDINNVVYPTPPKL